MKAISLKNPYPNGIETDKEELLEPFISILDEIRDKIISGEKVYIRITAGERKGSIAYIDKFDPAYTQPKPPHIHRHHRWGEEYYTRVTPYSFYVILGWDGRRNKIRWPTYNSCEYLRDYEGPTVWEKFDKKAAEMKLLEETEIIDREGNELNIGDRILYINARYGCAASLDRGIIEKIKFNVQKTTQDTEYKTVHVIIKNDKGEKSDIKNPKLSILKT